LLKTGVDLVCLCLQIVQLLLRHGADITLRNYEGQSAVEVASNSIRSLLLESVERATEASHQLLLQAAWQGDIKVVNRLLVSHLGQGGREWGRLPLHQKGKG